MATITVGQGRQYATIAAGLAAAHDGDVVQVLSGTYVNDIATIRTKVTLNAVGGQVTMLGTARLAAGRGLLTVNTDATIDGFVFAGAAAADGAGAGLLYAGGNLVVKNSLFVNNQDGLLAGADAQGTITIQASEFSHNGNDDGFSHNVSVGAVKSLTIQDSYIHDAVGGDEVKSRAKATTITNTRIEDNGADSLAAIDLPNGGVVTLRNDILEKGAGSNLAALIRNGGDTVYAGSSLTLSASTLVADRKGATIVQNTAATAVTVSGNTTYGFSTPLISGPGSTSGNTTAATRPTLSTAPLLTPPLALPSEPGRTGAVVTDGDLLTVGSNGSFSTLAAALAVADDGDTIRLAPGAYATASVTIDHKLVIEGAGGMARLTPAAASGSAPQATSALITTTADVTLRNIEISGVGTPGGATAAIRDQAGTLTLVNTYIHDNQAGITADAGLASRVAVYDSEIARNGAPNGAGANIDVAGIGTLVLRNDWIHDAVAGPEVRSRADNTIIDSTRISQAAGNGAANLSLPDGGLVSVMNSLLLKGDDAQATPLVQIGGGIIRAASSISLVNDTFISELVAPTTFVAAAPGAVPVSVTSATFVGGAPGSIQVQNGSNTGAAIRTSLTVSEAAPWSPGGASATAPAPGPLAIATPTPPAPGRGTLVLHVSEDAWRGDARFTIQVDGQQVGGTLTATAAHGAGQSQAVTIAGTFAAGPHSVAVRFINDQQGGAGEDRNLYVDALHFDGEDLHQTAALTANGAALLSTGPISRPTPVVVNVSERAANGDAQAFIAIDGKVLGGLQMVTASHADGRSTALNFLPSLAPGAHTASVTFLNPAAGRALFIDSIDIAGAHYPSAAAFVAGGAPTSFAFTVAPPAAANTDLFTTVGAPQVWTPQV